MRIDEKTYKKMPPEIQSLFVKLPNHGSDEVVGLFPETTTHGGGQGMHKSRTFFGGGLVGENCVPSSGSAARFFYCAKASKKERYFYLTCNCETVKLSSWQKQDQNQKEQTGGTLPKVGILEKTSVEDLSSNMSTDGKKQTGQSQMVKRCITSTETNKTTGLKTSNLLPTQNTSESTEDASCETGNGGSRAGCVANSSQSQSSSGTSPQKGGRCTGVVVPATSAELYRKSVCADCGSEIRIEGHPTQKPLALMEYLCKLTKTPTGGVVLDPFMGSGTTGMACVNTGRDFIGIEMDKGYFKIAKDRIEQAKNLFSEAV